MNVGLSQPRLRGFLLFKCPMSTLWH
uniref:Uncharacterized protein n=1 Tax=Anguilla anguilla TaxID=7936 RepID=A0A0E9W406_ANGAN